MNKAENIANAMIKCSTSDAVKEFITEQNDSLTNEVREILDSLDGEKIIGIQSFLNHLLNVCYDGKLFDDEVNEDDSLIKALSEEELFLFKETIIYFLGRLSILPNIDVLKKAYYLDENKYIKLNLVFASLCTFDEEIELDFVNRIKPGNEYDIMIRSWTMAFFKHADNPYEYVDNENDDWTVAKTPRLKRLSINNESNSKFLKAMSFRLLDFLVIYLFLENRKNYELTLEEKEIIDTAFIDYEKYSEEKKSMLLELKRKCLISK